MLSRNYGRWLREKECSWWCRTGRDAVGLRVNRVLANYWRSLFFGAQRLRHNARRLCSLLLLRCACCHSRLHLANNATTRLARGIVTLHPISANSLSPPLYKQGNIRRRCACLLPRLCYLGNTAPLALNITLEHLASIDALTYLCDIYLSW